MRLALSLIALIVALALIALSAMWYLLGGRMYSVQTNSMQPAFKAGDAVLSKRIGPKDVALGTVISYRDRSNQQVLISHRVVQVDRYGFITKGDNNPEQDLPIAGSAVHGQVYAVAPKLGAVLSWLRTPLGLTISVYVPAFVACSLIVARVLYQSRVMYRLR